MTITKKEPKLDREVANTTIFSIPDDIKNKKAFAKFFTLIGIWVIVVQLGPIWIRAVHMVSGFIWWGMVFFINFIILPSFSEFSKQTKYELLGSVFPRIFKNATTFGFLAVSLGWYYALRYFAYWELSYFTSSVINILFFVGITLLTGLYLFHTFLERHEITLLRDVGLGVVEYEDERVQSLVSNLMRLPRVGFLIQSFAVFLMFLH